ncbi:ABC transporter ATP-binding protein [Fictibacillus norfolkensis]|jgi:ABC-2 type transport system ATP-binding protein|uniref:ABC transporter ATP-binding protein n=1 Tax=Fictibacillus norfolkensis TaxID=2762233 RepID=A0ABR8SNL4_9BACL|nr:ABC transporter ATP-binding protein [Fictibacillus norfolkensis]MBD7965093.1 ABC transporter ATP-binding protein [Fictibacillus norfolkensis]
METIIELVNVSKQFKNRTILQDVNLKISKGQSIGIIGPNGSGKSVLFKLIAGFIKPDNGDVYIRGQKLGKDFDFPNDTGVLINNPGYIGIYSGLKNLKFLAEINNKIDENKVRETLRLVGLDPDDKTRVSAYSLGMKKKLGIAQAIMEDQNIIILDEPFNALDIKSYKDAKNIIKQQQEKGHTILLTSHNQADIEELCDEKYIIIDNKLERLTKEIKEAYLQI